MRAERLVAADLAKHAATEEDPEGAVPISLSVFWAPYDFLKRSQAEEEE